MAMAFSLPSASPTASCWTGQRDERLLGRKSHVQLGAGHSFSSHNAASCTPVSRPRSRHFQVRAQARGPPGPGAPKNNDNATVLVIGGGGLGLEVARQLTKAGSWVTVVQRSEKYKKKIEEMGAVLAIGNVLYPNTLKRALRANAFDAVVCTVGGGIKNYQVDGSGVINVVQAAIEGGVNRFVMVSSIGAGNSQHVVDDKTMETLKGVLKAKTVAEESLDSSGLAHTIIRPGGLTNDEPTGKGILTENTNVIGQISRKDVASLIVKILFDERTFWKTYSAVDAERLIPPTPPALEGVELFAFAEKAPQASPA